MTRRVRLGIDVGGTFTKAVAIDTKAGALLAKSTVPTTHAAQRGVSEGIIKALNSILEQSNITTNEIEIISHSTTQTVNALLESDVYKVGIVAMGVGPTKSEVTKRTSLTGSKNNMLGQIYHTFLDTSHLIAEEEADSAISELRSRGADVIVATEAYGVDDPSNEMFITKRAQKLGVPATASHEISGIYGLEIRTLTAAINASVLPKTFQVADFVEDAINRTGIQAPLMIMKGDGGVTSMNTFKTKPILTILSGPAASVVGALLYLKITNGIFIEVGGTSTNICIIRNGKPEFRYVTIRDHPTCIHSMDVRILGVAGGSMVALKGNSIARVGPRSAHIAGLKYSCHTDLKTLKEGKIVLIPPRPGDYEEYVAIRAGSETFAITNTCAANALGMIPEGDYSYAGNESAKAALELLGQRLGVSYFEAAQSIIQTASFEITRTVSKILKEFKIKAQSAEIIGGGGGATVLVPFVAKQLGIRYRKANQAEVISSIGVAASMIQEEQEVSMVDPTPENISHEHRRVQAMLVDQGAVPESIVINSEFLSDKSILRITATGNVELDSAANAKNVFTVSEAKNRASEIMQTDSGTTDLVFQSKHYFVFDGRINEKKLFLKRERHHIVALDAFGRMRLSVENGRIFYGEGPYLINILDKFFASMGVAIAPRVYLINELKMMDFSSLTSKTHIMDAIRGELGAEDKGAIVVEIV